MEDTDYDILDDWFIQSLKIYKDLHVYQLEHPTSVLEWTSEKTVCVAGSLSAKNEILELWLPPKLFAHKNKGLCAERDFKVAHGGFTDGPVNCLRHIPGTRCVVTNDGLSSTLQLWEMGGDDSDVMTRTGCVYQGRAEDGGSQLAARQTDILHGGQLRHVQLTHLTSRQTLYTLASQSSDLISALQFVSSSVFLAGCCNGSLVVVDTREPHTPPPSPALGEGAPWCMDVSAHGELVRLSAQGQLVLSDLRDIRREVGRVQLDPVGDGGPLQVSWAPVLEHCMSLSGFRGTVQIFDTSTWSGQLMDPHPLFEHRGHKVSWEHAAISSHSWHPSRARTLLSAASDGSVHLWDWVNSTASK